MVWMVKDLRDKISCSFFAASLTHTLVNHIHSIPYQHEGSLPILFSVIQFHFTWFSVALLIFRSCGSVFLFSFVHQHTQRHTQTWSRNSSRRLVLGRNFSTFSRLHINSKKCSFAELNCCRKNKRKNIWFHEGWDFCCFEYRFHLEPLLYIHGNQIEWTFLICLVSFHLIRFVSFFTASLN